jgi:putative nucleotidyltransferase with HDIG domain
MTTKKKVTGLSIFSRTLDRVAVLTFGLGAGVPLAALAYLVQEYVLPEMAAGPFAYGLVGLVLSIGALSLASFLILQRVTHQALRHLDEQNQRLETMFEAARWVAEAPYGDEVLRAIATCATRLGDAPAAFVLVREEKGAKPELAASAGEKAAALFPRIDAKLESVIEPALAQGRPLLWSGADAERAGVKALAVVPLLDRDAVLGALMVARSDGVGEFDESHLNALSTLAALAGVARHNAELRDSQRNFFVHVTEILMSALDVHVDTQAGHARRVAFLANRIGREMGFEGHDLERLHFGALLHDIGMLKMEAGQCEDQTEQRRHPVLGHQMLKSIRLWEDLAPVVLHHHEWFDGTGYPEGLAGSDIPLEARIISLAEAFDSMTAGSSYKHAIPVDEALHRIEAGAGSQFDPEAVPILVRLVREGVITLPLA